MHRSSSFIFVALVAGIFTLQVSSVHAVRDTDLEMQYLTSCSKQGYPKSGIWATTISGKTVKTDCAADFAYSTGVIHGDCNSGNAICCLDKENKPHCLPFTDTTTMTSSTATNKIGSCTTANGSCTANVTEAECKKLKGTFSDTKTCPLFFEPNVPIPNLFEGSQPVNESLLARYVGAFYIYFAGVAGILAIVMIMWGGYHYITSFGNPQRMNQGKEIISSSLIGLILVLTSFLLLKTINPELINLRGITPTYLSRVLQDFEKTQQPAKEYDVHYDVSTKNLQTILQRVKTGGFDTMISDNSGGDTELAYRGLALLFIESSGKPTAASNKNAYGLMQMIPSTAKQYGVANPRDLFTPAISIRAGMAFLKDLKANPCPSYSKTTSDLGVHCLGGDVCQEHKTDYKYMNAAYNGGRGANFCSKSCVGQTFWECKKNPKYGVTRSYTDDAQKVYDWLKKEKVFG